MIIEGKPAEGSKGLVAQRKSALYDAKRDMDEKIIDSLVIYNLNYNLNKLHIKEIDEIENIQEIKDLLFKKLSEFLEFGYIAYEYYNEDNSAVIVYRIFKEELIKKGEEVREQIITDARENSKKTFKTKMKQLDKEISAAGKKLEQEIEVFSDRIKEIFI